MLSLIHIEIDYNNPKEAEEKGLTFIHQELNLYPELTVLDNVRWKRNQKQNRNTK